MIDFIKSMDNKTRKAVIKRWTHLIIIGEDGTQSLKPEAYWSKEEDDESCVNSYALNTIFNEVDKNGFFLINTCTKAK